LEIVNENFIEEFSKGNNSIDKSISGLEITKIQHQYLIKYGRPEIPDDYNQSAFEDYVDAIKIKNSIGWQKKLTYSPRKQIIIGKDFNITSGQARYLIGAESKILNKKLTIADLSLTEQQKIELLGVYSPILNRNFTHDDLNLDTDIEKQTNTTNMSPLVTPLSQTEDNNSGNILDILEFKYNLRLQDLITPTSMFIEAFSTFCEFMISYIIANKRYSKVKKRNQLFFDPKKFLEKALNTPDNQLLSAYGLNILKTIFILQPLVAENSKLIDIKNLLVPDGKNIFLADIKNICNNLINLLQSPHSLPKKEQITQYTKQSNKLENLYNDLSLITEDKLFDVKLSKTASSIFKIFGIILKYKTTKLLGKYIKRTNIQAINHKLKIEISTFHKFLKVNNLLPNLSHLFKPLRQNMVDLCILHKISKLDQRKIKYHKTDKKLKYFSILGSLIPIIPVNDVTKVYMYNRGKAYRTKNQYIINTRIDKALTLINSNTLTCDEKNSIKNKLTSIKNIKNEHLQIKIKQNQVNSFIHSVSAAMFFTSILFGPIGSAVKAGVKSSSKLSTSVAGSVKRYKTDSKHKKAESFITTKDVYIYFKELYLSAKKQENTEKMKTITDIAKICFQLEPEAFDLLIATKIIENDIYKINLSQKIT
jgi:hypothetical protein